MNGVAEVYEREVRDLPCFEYRTTVVIELYRLQCPDCGLKAEKVAQLPSKAPFSKRFEDAVGLACESARRPPRGQTVWDGGEHAGASISGTWSDGRLRGAPSSVSS